MNANWRRWICLVAIAAFAVFFFWGLQGVPPLGHYKGPYGDAINQTVVKARHITDAVTAVNFDYRGIDTLAEEFILFVSVTGVVVLLRQLPDEVQQESKDSAEDRQVPRTSDAVRVMGVGLLGLTALFGIYLITHGTLTPGGGFQGGVILASAFLLVYIAGSFAELHGFMSYHATEIAEACGIAGFLLLGIVGLLSGEAFLQNVLPLGQSGSINGGGTVPYINIAVGLAVSDGFLLLLYAFLENTLTYRLRRRS